MFTVFQINPSNWGKIRPLFTGRYSESIDAIKHLIDNKNWDIEHIGLFDCTNGRWASFNLMRLDVDISE